MKKITLLLLLAAYCANCLAQTKLAGRFVLNGKVAPAGRAYQALLEYKDADGNKITDSTLIKSGRFTFKGILNEPAEASLSINKRVKKGKPKDFEDAVKNYYPTIGGITLFLEPRVISVTSASDSLGNAVIKAGTLNYLYTRLKKNRDVYWLQLRHLDSLDQKIDTADYAAKNRIGEAYEKLRENVPEKVYKPFLLKHLNSYIAVYALSEYATRIITEPDKVKQLLDKLPQWLQNTPTAGEIKKQIAIAKATNIGQTAPDFTEPDSTGRPVNLYSLKGKYILLDFWASWCFPCRGESPFLLKAYHKYKGRNFTILSVSTDRSKKAWLDAIKEDRMEWIQVSDLRKQNTAAQLYGIKAIPQNFLINPHGKIIAKNLRGEELDKTLDKLLSK